MGKITHYYIPPLSIVRDLTVDQIIDATVLEQIADEGSIAPKLRILYEVDCDKKQIRELSIILSSKSSDEVNPWAHVAGQRTKWCTA